MSKFKIKVVKVKNLKPRNFLVTLCIKRKAGKHKNKKKEAKGVYIE